MKEIPHRNRGSMSPICAARHWVTALVLVLGVLACRDLTGKENLPPGVRDPASFRTPEGALQMYHNALAAAVYSTVIPTSGTDGRAVPRAGAFIDALVDGGLLTDELQPVELGGPPLAYASAVNYDIAFDVDARQLPETFDARRLIAWASYGGLQALRAKSSQAIGALRDYRPDSEGLRAHLYTLMGYAEIFLADLGCSGVPLSTLDYNNDYTYRAGSTTQEIYLDAIAKFDTAIMLAESQDSVRIVNFARVGRARALLNVGRLDDADQTAAFVPQDFEYTVLVDWQGALNDGNSFLTRSEATANGSSAERLAYATNLSNGAGGNGFAYRTSGDPRTASDTIKINGVPLRNEFRDTNYVYFPNKFGGPTAKSTVTIASGLEAKLIHAEVVLGRGDGNMAMQLLNTLRQPYIDAGTLTAIPTGLTRAQQIDTLFRERAAWLYLTGHRQGDLRRLVRQYSALGFTVNKVYPTGLYGAFYTIYGTYVDFPIPEAERANPKFSGCITRGA